MAFVFEMPEIGEGVVEGEVVAWHVGLGDAVAVDQPLCEVMTDKATVEIPSPRAGTVVKLHGEPGDIIAVHAPLVEIDENGGGPAVAAPVAAPPAPTRAPAAAAPIVAAAPSVPEARGPTKAAPAVRRHAREEGIDIGAVAGTGKGGRVTRGDIDRFITSSAPLAEAPLPIAPPALPMVQASADDQKVKIIGLRRKIATQMVAAKRDAPHFTYVEEVDATRLFEARQRLKPIAAERGVSLSFLPFIAKACSIAFRDFPNVNALMDTAANELTIRGEHNIGIACDTPQGLFVPVIKNVERKTLLQIAADIAALVERTRAGRASMDDLTGGTFTITGVGQIGGVLATPILNVPEVAIMGFNVIRDRAVVVDGEIVARKMTWLSPTFDHRIVDGAMGARFTARVKQLIENPEAMLLEMV
jgi:pyruvate dehydrogenase E2 component (dihydrolipoamide acetyltransferase)